MKSDVEAAIRLTWILVVIGTAARFGAWIDSMAGLVAGLLTVFVSIIGLNYVHYLFAVAIESRRVYEDED